MLITLNPETDDLILTVGGKTHGFPAERLTVRRDETTTRGGGPVQRYLTIVVQLDDEYPETPTV